MRLTLDATSAGLYDAEGTPTTSLLKHPIDCGVRGGLETISTHWLPLSFGLQCRLRTNTETLFHPWSEGTAFLRWSSSWCRRRHTHLVWGQLSWHCINLARQRRTTQGASVCSEPRMAADQSLFDPRCGIDRKAIDTARQQPARRLAARVW